MSEKRWKKSEYRAARIKHWFDGGSQRSGEGQADDDVNACEAAGIDWLPEEPELPRNIVAQRRDDTGLCYFTSPEGRTFHRNENAALYQALAALWGAFGPAGNLRKRLEDALWAFRPRDSEGEEFITIRVALLSALLAKPWEEKP